ncbi:MAG: hypothetical protein LIO56_04760 [Lachnospiraceae bacterium]|nr:hypothetical protein [Lachnospiraceae bacterium]
MELACGTGYWIATKTDENTRSKDISGIELDMKTNLVAVCKTKKHSKYLKELQEIYRQNLTEKE